MMHELDDPPQQQHYPMASRYNIIDYESDDEQDDDIRGPSNENLVSAASFVTQLLNKEGINYALMGAFALKCFGSNRDTNNVDIAVDTSMKRLWQIIEPEDRLVIPQSRLVADVMKIFVKTGPGYDHCRDTKLIEVEMISPEQTLTQYKGSNGSPRDIGSHQQMLVASGPLGEQVSFKALDVLYLLRSKMDVIAARGAPKDFLDVQFIIDHWSQELAKIQGYAERIRSDIDSMLTPPPSP
ncbi:hypothetical protein CJF31_00001630 [Rutstroemia sp. NJR-2017a BVV2]|nr:hypothetical protein CJF31_00001630 [Rutstroemia sp. NJR-2017a BVV2]